MRFKFLSVLLVGVAIVAGCSKPVLHFEEPSSQEKNVAVDALDTVSIPPARRIPESEMLAAVARVEAPIRRSAYEVCNELGLPWERCQNVLTSQLTVSTRDADMNAYADIDNNVGFTGGMVHYAGSDQELAAVYAHELAHVMYGHVDKKVSNAMVGALIGGGIAWALARDAGPYYDDQTTADMIEAGAEIGSLAYSPEMEIEADRTAIYILENAGYSPGSMRDIIVRLHRHQDGRIGGHPYGVGFLTTHPSDDRRIAHIISAIDDVEYGVPLRLVE